MVGKKWRTALAVLLMPAIVVVLGWCAAALWFDGPSTGWLAGALAVGFPAGCLALLVWVRPLRRAMIAVMLAVVACVVWWLQIPPRNDRELGVRRRAAPRHFDRDAEGAGGVLLGAARLLPAV